MDSGILRHIDLIASKIPCIFRSASAVSTTDLLAIRILYALQRS